MGSLESILAVLGSYHSHDPSGHNPLALLVIWPGSKVFRMLIVEDSVWVETDRINRRKPFESVAEQ